LLQFPKETAMVSAWWLLVAFWVGACLGILLAAAMTVSKGASEKEASGSAPKGRLSHGRR
jgi:hypothetical protein